MTLTPEQLDAIATKLMGWKRVWIDPTNKHLFPWTTMHGDFWQRPDGSIVDGPHLSPSSPADAMLVLKAIAQRHDVRVETAGDRWKCRIVPHYGKFAYAELADTPEAAIFAAAAQLMERMDEQ